MGIGGQKEGHLSSAYICTEVEKASVSFITLVSSFAIVWNFFPNLSQSCAARIKMKSDDLPSQMDQPFLFTKCLSSLVFIMTEITLAIVLIAVNSAHG